MAIPISRGRKAFNIINYVVLTVVSIICILPFVHLLAVAFSSGLSASAGQVTLYPIEFTTEAFYFLAQKKDYLDAVMVSFSRVMLGTTIGMFLVIMVAYPLSKNPIRFRGRSIYVWYFAFTMFFGGGLIPTYMVIKELHLINTIWALVLPGAMSVWNTVILLNFFRSIPDEMEESARLDGANHFTILLRIYIPLAKPAIATLTLFTVIFHWNAWFDGIMYINNTDQYPLQTYLSTLILAANMKASQNMTLEQLERMQNISDVNLRAAQIFVGALPIMVVFPFLQRFFVKGLTLGGVKG